MKIYLDLVFILNFVFDFLLLMTTSILLRRRIKLRRIILGALIGSISIGILFIKITSLQLFLLKIFISILMCLVTFSYKDFKYTLKNIGYLYMTSLVLGGFLYFLNTEFSYKQEGLVFFYEGLSINYIFLLIFSPIILYIYIKQGINLKRTYNCYYKTSITIKNNIIKGIGYLDTGNNLKDPITGKMIILVNPNKLKNVSNYYFVPYETASSSGLLKCMKADKIIVEKYGFYKNALIGIMDKKINIDGVDFLLNNRMEKNND